MDYSTFGGYQRREDLERAAEKKQELEKIVEDVIISDVSTPEEISKK